MYSIIGPVTLKKLFYIHLKFIYKYKDMYIYLAKFVHPFLGLFSASPVHSECDCQRTKL